MSLIYNDPEEMIDSVDDFLPTYCRHYIISDARGLIADGWSDGPHPERDTSEAICINEQGDYQFRLFSDGEENPMLYTMDGIPLYRWDGEQVIPRAGEEIEADRAAIPAPEPTPSLADRMHALETETAAISAAIERGLSL